MPGRPVPFHPTGTRYEGVTAISRDLRINQMIRVPQVRVVDEDGSQLGVMHTADALRLAQERGFDLVEVAPMASPPVTRLLDFGQYKYELTKREKEAKRKQRSVSFKEIRLKPKIGQGDFDTKVRRAIEFLEEGDRVKVAVQFRGRELTHPQIGRDLLTKFSDQIKDHGLVERAPLLEGKSMHISVASTHKPKVHEPVPAGAAPAGGTGDRPGDAEAAAPAASAGTNPSGAARPGAGPAVARAQGPRQAAANQPPAQAATEGAGPAPRTPTTSADAAPRSPSNGQEPTTDNAASASPNPPAAQTGPDSPAPTGE